MGERYSYGGAPLVEEPAPALVRPIRESLILVMGRIFRMASNNDVLRRVRPKDAEEHALFIFRNQTSGTLGSWPILCQLLFAGGCTKLIKGEEDRLTRLSVFIHKIAVWPPT